MWPSDSRRALATWVRWPTVARLETASRMPRKNSTLGVSTLRRTPTTESGCLSSAFLLRWMNSVVTQSRPRPKRMHKSGAQWVKVLKHGTKRDRKSVEKGKDGSGQVETGGRGV